MQLIGRRSSTYYWRIWSFGALLAVILALCLYLPQYGSVPAGLNRDEAALGYNAYSLLKTGKDEWGKSWPISITSFGDQKLPVYVYTLMPFLAVFGLEIWVVRLPSLLAGLMVIVGMGLLSSKLAKLAQLSQKLQLMSSWLVMALIAISPWNMHLSRVAYETHLAMALFVSSLTCLLFALDTKQRLQQRILLSSAGLLAGLTLLTYHSYQVFTPLFLLAFLIIFFKQIKKLDKVGLTIGILLGSVSVGLLITGGVWQANQIKSQAISPFSNPKFTEQITAYRTANNLPSMINKLLFNQFSEGLVTFAQNYVTTFAGGFFFVHGSNHGDHNPGNGSNLHLFLAPFILLGIILISKYRRKPATQIIITWLLLALIPSALTTNPLLEVRIAAVFPILELLATIGIIYLCSLLAQRYRSLCVVLLIAIGLISTMRLFIFYLTIAPQNSVNNLGYHLLAQKMAQYKTDSNIVLTQSPSSSPYIWYLFENKIDPTLAQQELVHYPITDEGFIHVQSFENVRFASIDWGTLAHGTYILFLKPAEISLDKRDNSQFTLLTTINDRDDQIIYEVWKYIN